MHGLRDGTYRENGEALWAVVLEVMCRCGNQEKWRGRSIRAVKKVMGLAGWTIRKGGSGPAGKVIRCGACSRKRGKTKSGSLGRLLGICTYKGCSAAPKPTPQGHIGRPYERCVEHVKYYQDHRKKEKP